MSAAARRAPPPRGAGSAACLARRRRGTGLAVAGLLLALAPAPAAALVTDWQGDATASVRLLSPWRAAPETGGLWLGLEFRLAPGWHVYWSNSGDAGYPPRVDFAATPGLAGAELRYPAPRRFDLPGGLVAFGYEGEVVYPVWLERRSAAIGPLFLEVAVDYLACAAECVPFRARLELTQPIGRPPVADPDERERIEAWRARLPRPTSAVAGFAVSAELALDARGDGAVAFDFAAPGLDARRADLFFMPHPAFELGAPQRTVATSHAHFRVPVAARRREAPPRETRFAWTLTDVVLDGAPLAVSGEIAVEVSRPPSRVSPFGYALLAATLVVAWFLLRRRAPAAVRPPEERAP